MNPAIAVRGLTKRFGDVLAVDALNLEVQPGQVYGLLGPNGAGKTTTIRCLMGYLIPDAGGTMILGSGPRDVANRRRIGYLPSDPGLDPKMRVGALLAWYADLRGAVEPATVTALCRRLDLDMDRAIGKLSRGNRQKVGVVQALMHDPDVVIMDEATSGLDPLVQREVLALVAERRDRGTAFLFSSHVLPEVEEIADVVGILRNGSCVVESTVQALATQAHQRLTLTLQAPPPADADAAVRASAGVVEYSVDGATVTVEVAGTAADVLRVLAPLGIVRVAVDERELDDVFYGYYAGASA